MLKKSINLITPRESESYILKRLRITLPITATLSLVVFIGLFILSIIYVNNNVGSYNQLKNKVQAAEKQIENQESKEGIYTLTSSLLDVIKQLLSVKKDHYPIYSNISSLSRDGITFTIISIDEKGKLVFTITIDNYERITEFISDLKKLEDSSKMISQIKAESISRDKKGNWELTFSMSVQDGK